MSDIFLSYASEDRDRILPLVNALEKTGWSVFWDRNIPAGKTWWQVIGAQIQNCQSVVVVWTENSIKSNWVYEEADTGKRKGILIPILFDKIEPPFGFGSIQAANLAAWDGNNSSPAFSRLISDIAAILGPSPAAVKETEDRRRLELEAQRKAEEERLRETERQRSEEEARRKADEENQRRIEEERNRAEREADRRRLEAEAQRKAEEERLREQERQRFEEEAKRRAEEENRRRIEEERKLAHEAEQRRREAEEQRKAEAEHLREQERQRAEEEARRKTEGEKERNQAQPEAEQLPQKTHFTRQPALGRPEGRLGPGTVFRDKLKDGSQGPEMVVIPAGTFIVGDNQGGWFTSSEKPVHQVEIPKPFAMGRYQVTFEEYDQFAKAIGRELPDDCGYGRGRLPVICVSWNDAVAYTAWLSEQTGKSYRLPSEAEWEYAARACTETRYWWGSEMRADMARYGKWTGGPAPVGSFKPNPFGLFDTAGNVWEWAQDCWHGDYNGAPTDGSAWGQENAGDCGRRVIRGGSWVNDPGNLRSSLRGWDNAVNRFDFVGFRLAQDLD